MPVMAKNMYLTMRRSDESTMLLRYSDKVVCGLRMVSIATAFLRAAINIARDDPVAVLRTFDSERERIVEANKKVLRETILALHIVATDADEHLTTLLSRQLFVRAIAARVPEGQLLQSMKKDQFKYGGVHSMAAAR